MNTSNESINALFHNISERNHEYIPLKVSIMTPYKLTIPIGCIVLSRRKRKDTKIKVNKFYIAKIWRAAGYEEKALMQMLKFTFSNLGEVKKVIASSYAENAYFICLLMGTGFRFNKQTKDNGDPKQRITLWIYVDEFSKLMENNMEEDVIKKKFYYKHQEDMFRNTNN